MNSRQSSASFLINGNSINGMGQCIGDNAGFSQVKLTKNRGIDLSFVASDQYFTLNRKQGNALCIIQTTRFDFLKNLVGDHNTTVKTGKPFEVPGSRNHGNDWSSVDDDIKHYRLHIQIPRHPIGLHRHSLRSEI